MNMATVPVTSSLWRCCDGAGRSSDRLEIDPRGLNTLVPVMVAIAHREVDHFLRLGM